MSCSIVSVLTQNGEVCPADAPVYGLFRAAHTCKYGHYFCDDPWLAVGVTILAIFAVFLKHFSGSSSEGQCTGTGPCVIGLSDLHRRGPFVVVHTPSRKPESETTRRRKSSFFSNRNCFDDFFWLWRLLGRLNNEKRKNR